MLSGSGGERVKAPHAWPARVAVAAVVSALLAAVVVFVLDDGPKQGAGSFSAASGSAPRPAQPATRRPNFLLVVTDDQQHAAFGGYDHMQVLRERLLPVAVDFELAFATNPSCCPMRASLLTGGYPRRHGTEAVGPPLGGASKFRRDAADRETIACWLQRAGYATGLFGKYMNFYFGEERTAGTAPNSFYVPPCWDRWRGMASPEAYGGVFGADYEIVAWDSASPTPVCRDYCPPGCRRCAAHPTRECSTDADCHGGKEPRCVGPGQGQEAAPVGCCGACSVSSERACNDDGMCPNGEHCAIGCRPTLVYHGDARPIGKPPGDADDRTYATDVLGDWVREFVSESVRNGKPFLAIYAPPAPHAGKAWFADPAARHYGKPEVAPWRPPSYDEADVTDKPRYIGRQPSSRLQRKVNDHGRQLAFSALLAVDEQLGLLLDHLERLGVYEDTVIAYVSDNGVCYGEHRRFLMVKEIPYECAIRVPIALSYPRRGRTGPRKMEDKIAILADVPVTFAELAGVKIPVPTDGLSLAGWITGNPPERWRRDVLLERWAQARADCLTYSANVRDGDRIRLYYGDRYERDQRLSDVFEWDADGLVTPGALRVPLADSDDASFAKLQEAILVRQPGTIVPLDLRQKSLSVAERGPAADGFYFWEEVDQAGAIEPCYSTPDFYGVRDERGFKYVEYNSGERELYDLRADPHELRNVYGDPAQGAIQKELDQRLDEILRGVPKRADRGGARK